MLEGLEGEIAKATGIRTLLADNPQQAVAVGTGRYIRAMADFDKQKSYR